MVEKFEVVRSIVIVVVALSKNSNKSRRSNNGGTLLKVASIVRTCMEVLAFAC